MSLAPVHLTAHVHGLGFVGFMIGARVLGMFAPSPLWAWMADWVGSAPVAASGMSLLAAAGVTGAPVNPNSVAGITLVLMMLGISGTSGSSAGAPCSPLRSCRICVPTSKV